MTAQMVAHEHGKEAGEIAAAACSAFGADVFTGKDVEVRTTPQGRTLLRSDGVTLWLDSQAHLFARRQIGPNGYEIARVPTTEAEALAA
jgi:hypothetical protein